MDLYGVTKSNASKLASGLDTYPISLQSCSNELLTVQGYARMLLVQLSVKSYSIHDPNARVATAKLWAASLRLVVNYILRAAYQIFHSSSKAASKTPELAQRL